MVYKNKKTTKNNGPKKSVKEILVEKIVSGIQAANKLPWESSSVYGAINPISGTEYRGLNAVLLAYGSGQYMTKNQLDEYNRKHKTEYRLQGYNPYIVSYNGAKKKALSAKDCADLRKKGREDIIKGSDETGYYMEYRKPSYFVVFDTQDIVDAEGSSFPRVRKVNADITPNEEIEKFIKMYFDATGVQLKNDKSGTNPFYTESSDYISMPSIENFKDTSRYYSTLFHEMVHSTGVTTRLNRKCFREYSEESEQRSREELIAEVGSWILRSEFNLPYEENTDKNSVAYIQSWCKFMENNIDDVMIGISEAEKAVAYIKEKAGMKPKDAPKPKEAYKPSLTSHLNKCIRTEVSNAERTNKLHEKFQDKDLQSYLKLDLGFRCEIAPSSKKAKHAVYTKMLSSNTKLYVGYTFAFIVETKMEDDENTSKKYIAEEKIIDLYQIGRNATLTQANEIALRFSSKVPSLVEYTKLLGLRKVHN